ncbi:MAG: sigma-54 dependent transcriptional regulator [candidate division KSB1 bacterium]|nr:sigma-54 dependent transcriptional regulator [candidate division KSB1 bacterium]
MNKVLVVDDDPDVRQGLLEWLQEGGYDAKGVSDGIVALDELRGDQYDVVLLDLYLPRLEGMKVLDAIVEGGIPVAVIVMSAYGTIQLAVEATKKGAFDFLEKPLSRERVLVTVRNALGKRELEAQRQLLLEEVREKYRMVGQSPAMERVFYLVDRAARSDAKVLILGENGTGKELVARAIHMNSARAGNRFVAVNCAAVPAELIESELFGHCRGAFTGAYTDTPGKFRVASGGTLFLDEIGDMTLHLQSKLLRALEDGEIYPVGSAQPVAVDVRFIAATNQDLEEKVRQGTFREDLYYRLNVIRIELPPLRERKEDIPILVDHFMRQICEANKVPLKTMTPSALSLLLSHSWPGNVRELRNVIEKLIVLYPEELHFDLHHVAEALRGYGNRAEVPPRSLKEAREEFEKRFIEQRLVANNWRIQETAKQLGIERTQLWKKMKRYGLGRKKGLPQRQESGSRAG